ncbi:Ribonucleotide reductase of class III (anaerobic), activating protein [Staphylococcus aureus]|nr:Ribonucleotide reductase of class III (anaerobic), activating protein [Staphylococcus aureus]
MTLLDIKQGQGYIAKIESNSFVDGEGVRCKGSLNQRIIDVQQSLSHARMIEYIVS